MRSRDNILNGEGNFNQESNFGATSGRNLGNDMVTGWKVASQEDSDYQTDIFSPAELEFVLVTSAFERRAFDFW